MVLEKINSEKILVTLSKEETELLNATFEKLALNNITNKLKQLLKKINIKKEINNLIHEPSSCFNVEFLIKNDKYSIFITREKNNVKSHKNFFLVKKEAIPYIFKFKNLNDFMDLSKKLSKNNFRINNSLFMYEKNYYSILYFKNATIPDFEKIALTEHAIFIGKGWTIAAKILEFGKEIVKDNAILNFGKFL